MIIEGAVIKEQGVTFAITIVKHHVLRSPNRDAIRQDYKRIFGPMPIVLMGQTSSGRPEYYGHPNIVNFLKNVPLNSIPWKRYTI